jgi:ribosome-associated toxin RatA of RatAB toxin-antitoxin module
MKRALIINATFSGISGILIIIFRQQLMTLFGALSTIHFLVVGALLIFFSLTILYETKRQNTLAILWIIIQDMLWVIGSIWLLIFHPFDFSRGGNYTIGVVAVVVLLMAFNQSSALAQVDNVKKSGLKQIIVKRQINSSRDSVWKVMADVGNFHKVAPNLVDVKIVSGSEKGLVRNCSHNDKQSWTETCTAWEPGREYSFEVNTSAPDYPYPLKYLKGTFIVEELTSTTSKITMVYDFVYTRKIYNVILYPLMKPKFNKTLKEILDNWQNMIEKGILPIKN